MWYYVIYGGLHLEIQIYGKITLRKNTYCSRKCCTMKKIHDEELGSRRNGLGSRCRIHKCRKKTQKKQEPAVLGRKSWGCYQPKKDLEMDNNMMASGEKKKKLLEKRDKK